MTGSDEGDACLFRVGTDGELLWFKLWETHEPTDVAVNHVNGVPVAFTVSGHGNGGTDQEILDGFATRFDLQGNIIAVSQFGDPAGGR